MLRTALSFILAASLGNIAGGGGAGIGGGRSDSPGRDRARAER
jgi:hypothetical protein